MIQLTVDNEAIHASPGVSVLTACLSAGIYIPHLCWLETEPPDEAPAACRLCFVEIDGYKDPVTACTVTVENGLRITTDTKRVRDLQKTGLKLLLSVHRVECKQCPANRACGLQTIARFLGAGLSCKPFQQVLKEPEVDSRHPVFDHFPNRCVLCGICIRVCRARHGQTPFGFTGRGFDTRMEIFETDPDATERCLSCKACLTACPTGAIVIRSDATASDQVRKQAAGDQC